MINIVVCSQVSSMLLDFTYSSTTSTCAAAMSKANEGSEIPDFRVNITVA